MFDRPEYIVQLLLLGLDVINDVGIVFALVLRLFANLAIAKLNICQVLGTFSLVDQWSTLVQSFYTIRARVHVVVEFLFGVHVHLAA